MSEQQTFFQTQNNPPFLIIVTGNSEISVPPNLATVNIGVIIEKKSLLFAQQQNSQAINQVIHSLITFGILQDHIQTFDYRIVPEYDFTEGKQLFRGYKVTHILQIKIEDLTSIGQIVDLAVQQGANYIANVQFSIKDGDVPYRHALKMAFYNAFQKAQAIASSFKGAVTTIPVQVIERHKEESPYLLNQSGSLVKGITSTLFEPGVLKIKAMVTVHFHFTF